MELAYELRRVIATLDGVSVQGRDNMDRLLGCMIKLDHLASALEKAAATPAEAPEAQK